MSDQREVDLVITGGTVVTPSGPRRAGIAIDGERIVAICDDSLLPPSRATHDASGLHIIPGLVDTECHPGCYVPLREDLASESRAAVTSGVTTWGIHAPSTRMGHPEWAEFQATVELDARELLAREKGLQYIGLDGTVGIIANGAGLAMSTLDVVNQVGGSAANFLDIGGGANADVMAGALEVINSDKNVMSIFINIFGGITRGDEVAKGIVEALGRVDLRAPIVIRLDGTNATEGRDILKNAGIPESKLTSKSTMLEAAEAAVALAK